MTQGPPIRVMVVDDHPLVRSAVTQAIASPDIHVVAEAATAEEALGLAPTVAPDVILLDIALPGMSGVQLLRELMPRLPGTRVIMLTMSGDERDAAEAMRAGAHGYLTKDVTPEALARSVRAIRDGELVMPRRLAGRLLERLARRGAPAGADARESLEQLSPREQDVLRLLADGLTDREMAAVLTISVRTVETHVSSILHKLDVRNRAEAARRFREG